MSDRISEEKNWNLDLSAWLKLPIWFLGPVLFRTFLMVVIGACLLGDWGAFIADYFGWVSWSRENTIRYSGWLLDLAGLTIIASGILTRLHVFKESGFWSQSRDGLMLWWRRFPLIKRNVTVHLAAADIAASPAGLTGRGLVRPSDDASIERKVEFLMQRNDELTSQLVQLQDYLDEETARLGANVKELTSDLGKALDKLSTKTQSIHVGEVGMEIVGLAWIFLGITLSTVPELVEILFGGWLIIWFEVAGEFLWGSFVR